MPRRKRKHLGDAWSLPNLDFMERMELGKERAAMERAGILGAGRSKGRVAKRERPTSRENKAIFDEAWKAEKAKWLAESPCVKGRPARGGYVGPGGCSWHKGVKPLGPAPF
ncbi:MAG: hypothetical protein ACYC6M_05040 [Terriglobales bacterium]